jgi:hypothetical protein
MKSTKEITSMLVYELVNHVDKLKLNNQVRGYYNEILGDTSFLLAGLLESLLKKEFSEWNRNGKWIDDSLISNVTINNDKLNLDGIMIWGMENITEQWTDPFSFSIELVREEMSFKEFTFLFGDLNTPSITYEQFTHDRGYWIKNKRGWKYVIKSYNDPD